MLAPEKEYERVTNDDGAIVIKDPLLDEINNYDDEKEPLSDGSDNEDNGDARDNGEILKDISW